MVCFLYFRQTFGVAFILLLLQISNKIIIFNNLMRIHDVLNSVSL